MDKLNFIFLRKKTYWSKIIGEGLPAPEGYFFEVQVIPSGITNVGNTEDEAIDNARERVEADVLISVLEGKTPKEWYKEASNKIPAGVLIDLLIKSISEDTKIFAQEMFFDIIEESEDEDQDKGRC